jgi:hypothetical protein
MRGRTAGEPLDAAPSLSQEVEESMLWTIFLVLLIAWALGLVSGYTLGNFIHVLLVIALVVLVCQLLSGRRSIP